MESKLLAGGKDIISRRDEQQHFLEQQRQEMIEQRVSSIYICGSAGHDHCFSSNVSVRLCNS